PLHSFCQTRRPMRSSSASLSANATEFRAKAKAAVTKARRSFIFGAQQTQSPRSAQALMAFQKSDGMNYAPQGKPQPVVQPGEFIFAAVALDHGHIYGQCNGLREAGGELRYVFDPDPAK